MLEYNETGKELHRLLSSGEELPPELEEIHDSLVFFDDFFYEITSGRPSNMLEKMAKVFTPESMEKIEDAMYNNTLNEANEMFSAVAPEV